MGDLFRRVSNITPMASVAACAVSYLAVTAFGLMREGYNVDDWRHITGAYQMWVANEGRWIVDFSFRKILGQRFITPLQIFLSFFGFLWISSTLSKYAVQDKYRPITSILIFISGVNCPYMCDALSFNAHTFVYVLALAASIGGFDLIFSRWKTGKWFQNAVLFVTSAQLIAFSLGVYQPFALFGLIVPILCALRSDQTPMALLLQRTAICALACILALGLYLVEWRVYAATIGVEIVNLRFENPTLATTFEKLTHLPKLWKAILSGGLLTEPRALRLAEVLFAAFAMMSAVCAGLFVMLDREASRTTRVIEGLRAPWAAAAALLVLPAIFWFATVDTYAPSRAIGYFGFMLAAVIAASASLCIAHASRPRWILGCAGGALIALSVTHALAASALWDDRARLSQRDIELARALYARAAALPGHDGRRLRIVGEVKYPGLSWGDMLGLSVFHDNNPTHGIFKELFDAPARAEAMNVSPQACRAFPHPDAAFVHEGVAHICLNDFDAFIPVTDCVRLGKPELGELCLKGRAITHVTPNCRPVFAADEVLRISAKDARGQTLFKRSFLPMEFPGFMIDGRCYRVTMAEADNYSSISVSLYHLNHGDLWRRDYAVSDFRGHQ